MKQIYKYCAFLFLLVSMTNNVFAQTESNKEYSVSGVVLDDTGAPLPGVTIFMSDSKKGAFTDVDGKFTVSLTKSPTTIQFSFIGMKKKIVTVNSSSKSIEVKLELDNQLKEVVIEGGYGLAQKRSDMVGSAYQIQAKDIEKLPAGRLDKLLDGLIPGVTVQPNSDSPGSPRTRYNIRVRGDASLIASNEPLWIIDGIPVFQGTSTNMMPGASYTVSPLSYYNPEDIESISVLKDAASTSIYGANGANGVIIVTTKKGSKFNKISIDANVRYGVSSIDESTRYKMMNGPQYLAYAKEAWANGGQDINAFPYQDNDLNTYSTTNQDWGKLYFDRGQTLMAGLSLRGGNDVSSNYLSLSYYNEKETVKGNQQQRFSARYNIDYKFGDKLSIHGSLSTSYNFNNLFVLGSEYYSVLPILSPYYNDGYSYRLYNRVVDNVTYDAEGKPVYEWADYKFFDNSIPSREENVNKQRTFDNQASAIARYRILDGLELTEQFGVNIMTTNEEQYAARTTLEGMSNNVPSGYSSRASATYINWDNVLRLNYERIFGNYKVNALAGVEMQQNKYNTLSASGNGFLNDHIQEVGYSDETTRTGYSSVETKRSLSYLGQVGLSYKKRYFLTSNVRFDGNSVFGTHSRWAKFGSAGLSWNVSNEDFFKSKYINLLKLKASLGTNGNSRIDSSIFTGTYTYGDTDSYNGEMGATSSSIANPGLSWETTTMFNTGVRLEANKRWSFEVEYYNNFTRNLLTKIYTSRTITDDRLYANVGEMRNQGIEATINTKNITNRDFLWETNLIVSHNKNKIVKMYNEVMTSFGNYVWKQGEVKDAYYLVRWAGVDPATGAPMWYDKNGNLTFTYSTDNRVILKESPDPIVTGSLSNTFSYRDFSFNFMLNYSVGGHSLSALKRTGLSDGYDATSTNFDIDAIDHWSKPGDLSVNPRISTVSSKSSMYSTRYLYNTTNVKLQNMSLTYRVPDKLAKKLNMQGCTLSLIGDNLYLWTPDQHSGRNSYKTIMNAYPVERSFSLDIRMNF